MIVVAETIFILTLIALLALIFAASLLPRSTLEIPTDMSPDELFDAVTKRLAHGNWRVEERSADLLVLRRDPDTALGCLLLLLLLPIGIVYWLTDWGRGSLTVGMRWAPNGTRAAVLESRNADVPLDLQAVISGEA